MAFRDGGSIAVAGGGGGASSDRLRLRHARRRAELLRGLVRGRRGRAADLTLNAADAWFIRDAANDDLGSSVARVGDVNGDHRDDLPCWPAGSAIFPPFCMSSTASPSACPGCWTRTSRRSGDRTHFQRGGVDIRAAGNLDGDPYDDFILTGWAAQWAGSVYLPVFVNDFVYGAEGGLAADPWTSYESFPLVPLGNFSDMRMRETSDRGGGKPALTAADDLGRAWLKPNSTLAEDGSELFHDTGQVLLGRAERNISVDFVLEPEQPFYADPVDTPIDDYAALFRPHQFGGVGDVDGDGFADVAIADSVGSGLTVLFGGPRFAAEPRESQDAEPEEFDVRIGCTADGPPQGMPDGAGLAADVHPLDLDKGPWLAGSMPEGCWPVSKTWGTTTATGSTTCWSAVCRRRAMRWERAYLFLGPLSDDEQNLAMNQATLVFNLGQPANRMGDLDGDGQADLVFSYSYSSGYSFWKTPEHDYGSTYEWRSSPLLGLVQFDGRPRARGVGARAGLRRRRLSGPATHLAQGGHGRRRAGRGLDPFRPET